MRRAISAIVVILMSSAAGLVAQAPPQKPGPEHRKLEYFVGKWTSTGEMKPSPMGPGGKISMSDTCEWFQGGFAVVCHGQGTGPTGPSKNIGIMGYSTDQKKYTYLGPRQHRDGDDDRGERHRAGRHVDLRRRRDGWVASRTSRASS